MLLTIKKQLQKLNNIGDTPQLKINDKIDNSMEIIISLIINDNLY